MENEQKSLAGNRSISIVIPVYKSDESLVEIVSQINALNSGLLKELELIFVNDSPFFHKSIRTLDLLAKQYDFVKVITLRRNYGQHFATLVGLMESKGEYVITMDDDLQHPIEEIPKLIALLDENPSIEVAFAVPDFGNRHHSILVNAGKYVLTKIETAFLKKPKGLVTSSYRIARRNPVSYVIKYYNASPSVSSLFLEASRNTVNFKSSHSKRIYGKSTYTLPKLISLTLNNIVNYSALPLTFLGIVGVISFVSSCIYIILIVVRKLAFNIIAPGYASIIILILFFGSFTLLGMGIIGEYLIRIVKEQRRQDLKDLINNGSPINE